MFKKPQKTDKKSENTKNLDKQKSKKVKVYIPKRKKMIILGILLAVIILTATLVFIFKYDSNKEELQTDDTFVLSEEAKRDTENNLSNIYALNGEEAKALEVIGKEINNAKDDNAKVIAYNKQANVYMILKKYSNAEDSTKKAIAIKNNGQSWFIIGQIAEINNDNKAAIAAYQKAVDLTVKIPNDSRSDYSTYSAYLVNAKAKK